MCGVEVGPERCLDELSFHNILTELGLCHCWCGPRSRAGFVVLFCSSGDANMQRVKPTSAVCFTQRRSSGGSNVFETVKLQT